MILPIVAFGDPVLRKVGQEIDKNYKDLDLLISNMKQTMKNAYGVGLAAPQIGKAIRLFIVDTKPFSEDEKLDSELAKQLASFNKVFINPNIIEESGNEWIFNEGCLSIPNVRENVSRKETIVIEYFDEHFVKHTDSYNGIIARVIQHEYDHIEGVLFTDKLSSLKKKLIKKKLDKISKGLVHSDYRMKFPFAKR